MLNRTSKLIALHHAGGDNLQKLNGPQANEGIALKAINSTLTAAKSPTEE